MIETEGSRYRGSSLREYFEDELDQWEEEDPADAGLFVLSLAAGLLPL